MRNIRILFYLYEGTGMGHLTRTIRIATEFNKTFITLVVGSQKILDNNIPSSLEFIRIPTFQGRINKKIARKLKINFLNFILETYSPSVIFTDYLPSGKKEELYDIITNYPALKYFVLRGIIGNYHQIYNIVFSKINLVLLEKHYTRIFLTCDNRIYSKKNLEFLPLRILNKIESVGYVSPKIDLKAIENLRSFRKVKKDKIWVVCSTGSGKFGENIITKCLNLVNKFPELEFDFVYGDQSNLKNSLQPYNSLREKNFFLHSRLDNLSLLNAAADIVICSGGYNSLVEALLGRPKTIIVLPVQQEGEEQYLHTKKLSKFCNIKLCNSLENLESTIMEAINAKKHLKSNIIFEMDGVKKIFKICSDDIKKI